MEPICDSDLHIIYKNKKPFGIRDRTGILVFFRDISKYPDQEERYKKELAQQRELAEFILLKLKEAQGSNENEKHNV